MTLYLNLALAGLTIGSLASLAGLGVLLTYRATGVFNFAQGAVATVAAYVFWQLTQVWGAPVWVAALTVVLIVSPGIGLALEYLIFRRLSRGEARTTQQIVATLGVLVVLVGLVSVVWGQGTKTDVPSLFPVDAVRLGAGLTVSLATVAQLGILAAVCAGLAVIAGATSFGLQARAVVDRRDLATLTGVDADQVSAVAWGVGSGFAGLTGVLLAAQLNLSPFNLTLLVLETFAVVVLARLTSLGGVVAAGLLIGIAQAELTQLSLPSSFGGLGQALTANLFVVVLLVTLLLRPRLNEVGAGTAVAAVLAGPRPRWDSRAWWPVAALAVALPVLTGGTLADRGAAVLGLGIVFLSLVVVTGFGGQISLGQSGFAGLGALLSALLTIGGLPLLPAVPVWLAPPLAALLVVPLGALVGYPALRRQGLALGLTTLAVALTLYAFVFNDPALLRGLSVVRPDLGPLGSGPRAFYLYAALLTAGVLLAVRNLSSGRLGLALGAMRDSEDGARAVGLDLLRLKLLLFAVSSGMAALGGALLSQSARAFDPGAYQPLLGLLWFTAVVVAGIASAPAAVLAAAVYVAVDQVLPPGSGNLLFGLAALVLARAPLGGAGLVSVLRRARQPAPPPRITLNARGRSLAARLAAAAR